MKKKTTFLLICIISGAAVYFFPQSQYRLEPVYIAVVGPMGQASGKAMRQGVELYRDRINQQGGIDGRKLEIYFRDDQNKPEWAEHIAQKLAEENRVHLVLGHYNSSTSLSAGTIYKKNGIPAITGSASAESVTRDNEWYFRTVPGNILEAKFVASYMYDILSRDRNIPLSEIVKETIPASIIFSKDEYGLSLLESFEQTAKQFDIKIKGKWAWDDEKSSTEQVESITKKLTEIDDPGVIYFATHAAEGVKIITALKDADAGKTYPMIASAALARSFFDKLKPHAKEWEIPGYYSDGIYFVTPFMLPLSGVKGFDFDLRFSRRYNEEPGVVAACYYDAVHVAVQAMKKSGLHGKKYIREDRRNIRTALSEFYNEEKAVKGVTGLLWFDETGGVKQEYVVGRWMKQKALPSFVQYDQNIGNVDDVLQGYLDGNADIIDDLTVSSTQVVYVNIDNLKVLEINKKKSEFSAEFRLRFHYPARFDDSSEGAVASPLEFSSVLHPIVLGDPIQKENGNEVTTTKVFQVQGSFKADFNSDRSSLLSRGRKLFIHFRHVSQTYDNLIYVPGIVDKQSVQLPDGWSVVEFRCYSNVLSKKTTLGNPKNFYSDHSLDYSRFNVELTVVE